ncbi:MarR family winged helix-turn-helix transcriptional regulator [Desulfotomaculum copahuensis]|uniref:HTH marR-type domain-containing protein n=1 Tax=Desulfotomaculum copahuensis TaxID=1838280 RepID=A0A1B7LIG4_9FIRM|nr:MarR family transcriptional regulator [Desulfotomaculum copahuensis]OAT86357.1 hypothetical protein A6M21_16755 [Desulfotomaculum copahuensis]
MIDSTETRTELIKNIHGNLHRIHRILHRHMASKMHGLPVTPAQMGVLRMVRLKPGVTVSEMARLGMMTKSNISVMVDRLCREGLLEKRPDGADQRLLRLYLAAGGREILDRIGARHLAATQAALTGLTGEQLEQVAASLELLLNTLKENLAAGSDE